MCQYIYGSRWKIGRNKMIRVGDTIKELRLEKGLTLNELSEILGIEYSLMVRYEENRIVPRINHVSMMADFFGVNIGNILKNLQSLVY